MFRTKRATGVWSTASGLLTAQEYTAKFGFATRKPLVGIVSRPSGRYESSGFVGDRYGYTGTAGAEAAGEEAVGEEHACPPGRRPQLPGRILWPQKANLNQ